MTAPKLDSKRKHLGEARMVVVLCEDDIRVLAQIQRVYGDRLQEGSDKNVIASALRAGLAGFVLNPDLASRFIQWNYARKVRTLKRLQSMSHRKQNVSHQQVYRSDGHLVERVDVFEVELEEWIHKFVGDKRPNPEELYAEAEDPTPEK